MKNYFENRLYTFKPFDYLKVMSKYIRKTEDEFTLQDHYGQGWEYLTTESTWKKKSVTNWPNIRKMRLDLIES